MKKLYTSICIVLFLSMNLFAQEEMVAGWTFPGNALTADTGIAVNLVQEIYTVGGTSEIELKNGFETKAAQASGWNAGMDLKGWVVELNTQGFSNLSVSSRQQSGGNDPGPKYFKLQFSTDGGTSWTDLENGDITVENDWETSFVDGLPLPEECSDLEVLMVRWLMASDEASGSGGNVQESGKSKIDEIFIRGNHLNGTDQYISTRIKLFPNPASSEIRITSELKMTSVTLFDSKGNEILKTFPGMLSETIPLRTVQPGLYTVKIETEERLIHTRKVVVRK